MTAMGVRRSWRRLARSSVPGARVSASATFIALNRLVRSRTSVGPSRGRGATGLVGTFAVSAASRRSGAPTERATSHASGPARGGGGGRPEGGGGEPRQRPADQERDQDDRGDRGEEIGHRIARRTVLRRD